MNRCIIICEINELYKIYLFFTHRSHVITAVMDSSESVVINISTRMYVVYYLFHPSTSHTHITYSVFL